MTDFYHKNNTRMILMAIAFICDKFFGKMKRAKISHLLRRLRMLYLADQLRFYKIQWKNKCANSQFVLQHPETRFPPNYLMYESFQLNYESYYTGGKNTAGWIKELLTPHLDLINKKILDWGCGPGRVIRHLPEVINNGCRFYGTDYNAASIEWCKNNLQGIDFNVNTLAATLPYETDFFDAVYGISIFTHLSSKQHEQWAAELYRVIKPGGILLITTQGDVFRKKMTAAEIVQYNNGELVIRGNVKEGHRTYSAFQPANYMQQLFSGWQILQHLTGEDKGHYLAQDVWILKKL